MTSIRLLIPTVAALALAAPVFAHDHDSFADPIERSHGIDAWSQIEAVRFHIDLDMGDGSDRLAGTFTYEPGTGRVHAAIEQPEATGVFDGESAWVVGEFPAARFHLLTWPYFLAAPFKLQDPGSQLEPGEPMNLDGTPMSTARLTFGDGVGDTPDDWYVLYRAPENQVLAAMAYIVTYFAPAEEAEQDAHAIVYTRPVTVDGVTLMTRWTFHDWSEADGFSEEVLMRATISAIEFVEADDALFAKPDGAVEDVMPE